LSLLSNGKLKSFVQEYDILLMFAAFLVAITAITGGSWLSVGNIVNVVSRVAVLGILSIAQCAVILSGQMDLSVSSCLALFCSIYSVVFLGGYGIVVALTISSVAILLIGLVNGMFASRTTIPAFVVTLGTMMIAHSMHLYVLKVARYLPQIQNAIYEFMKPIPKGGELFAVFIWIAVFLVVSFMLSSTRFGRYVYAVGGNEKVSFYTGVPVRKIKFLVYMLSSALVCVASFVFLYKFANIAPGTGEWYLLDTIAAPIIGGVYLFGGRGKLWKAVMGALFLEILINFLRLVGVDPYIFSAIKGTIIAIGVIVSILLTPSYLRTRTR